MNITEQDQRLITTGEARQFDTKLHGALTFAEVAEMKLSRLQSAADDELGGWPEGFEFPTEAVAAFSVLALTLEDEAERMVEMAKRMRDLAPHLWLNHGPAVDDAS